MPPTYTPQYGLLTGTVNQDTPEPADWDAAANSLEQVARALGEFYGEGFFSATHFNVQPISGQPQAEMLNVDPAQSSSYGVAGTPGNRKFVFQNGSKTITSVNGIVMGTSSVLKTNWFWVKKVVGVGSTLEPDIVVTQTSSVPAGCVPFPCATMDFNDVEGVAWNNNPVGRVNLLPLATALAKAPVRAATTGNIALTAAQTIDGVAVVAGDRVLVKAQTVGANNGIYVCQTGAWTRAEDADASSEVKSGLTVVVSEGTVGADTQWLLTTNDPITLGTTALVFAQIAGSTPALINDQVGTAYTLVYGDMGKIVALNNAAAIALTVPAGLGVGFRCRILQKGAGQVTFTASGTTIHNRAGQTKTNAQYAVCVLEAYAADVFALSGDTGV